MTNSGPTDSVIVRAAIHPGIGVARIGNSKTEYYIGPEVTAPQPQNPGYYRDAAGAIKRQAARFFVYGYNAAGEVVRELTADNADIRWTVHVANRKAQWYQFLAALDIPEAVDMACIRRNRNVNERGQLAIDPGPRSITGKSVSGGADHAFDTGTFKKTTKVPLGEIRTDDAGRLIVLGGTGQSASPSGAPVYDPANPDSFNNADDWYDDTSDGPVTATVSIGGKEITEVDPAWVVVTPPNYAPDIISWRTMYDELCNVYVEAGMMKIPAQVSFVDDVLPILQRQCDLQWVNAGYAGMFGKGRPWDFNDPALLAKLAQVPVNGLDPYRELRRNILNSFRPPLPSVSEPPTWPHVWPWIYGDAFGSFPATGPGNMLPMTNMQYAIIKHWSEGDFVNTPAKAPPTSIADVPLGQQPAMLDKAALHYCLADTFHPGCEMTWPMRHGSMYSAPFRIRHRAATAPVPDYGASLTQPLVLQADGPLYAQGPGDITRWMALPWQGDTAFCRSGYDPQFDPYVPTFWAARVPNQVLTEEDYKIAIDTKQPREDRLAAFNRRPLWLRALLHGNAGVAAVMNEMIKEFGTLGIVEARPGVKNDPDIPEVIFVESIADPRMRKEATAARGKLMELKRPTRLDQAGWASEAQFHEFRRVRVRS